MTPHKAQCEFVFLCIHMSAYIMHYEINILNFAWANSLIILVDFSHRKWHPTRPNVYLFLYASIWVHRLWIMHYAIHILKYARVNSFILLVDFSHRKLHPTRHNVHFFLYASIWVHTLFTMHYAFNILACTMQCAISIMYEYIG